MTQQVWTSTQAARELGLDRSTAFRAAASGQVPGARRVPRPGTINAPWVATEAAWRHWYDHRRPAGRPPRKQQEQNSLVSLVVRPEPSKTTTPAELTLADTLLAVTSPEKREDFRLLMRSLGLRWTGSRWARALKPRDGEPLDRAVETGHRVLEAGFPVQFPSELIRDRAIAAQYDPAPACWVERIVTGEHTGWFLIYWLRTADYYRAAKAITGSHYVQGRGVAVPAEHFDEVLDFAQLHGAYMSPAARQLAEEARAARDAIPVVPVRRRPKVQPAEPPPVRPQLEVPEEVEIDDELRDEDETP